MSSYEILFLLTGILEIYAKYNFIQAFCGEWKDKWKFDVLFFGLYYIVSNVVYLVLDIPVLNMIVVILFLFFAGVLRGVGVRKAILSTILIVTISIALESAVVFATGYISGSILSEAQFSSEFGIVAFVLLEYGVSIGIKKYQNVRKDIKIPASYWIILVLFPLASLFLLKMIFQYSRHNSTKVAIGATVILMMNLVLFTMYDRLIWLYEGKIQKMASEHLNQSYKKQYELIKQSVTDVRGVRHDMNNHINVMEGLLKSEDCEGLQSYLNRIKESISNEYMISNTGNDVIDSIVNFEINQSKVALEKIKFITLNIPKKIHVHDFDLTVIFSNLMSNALTAVKKVEKGMLVIEIKYTKGFFFIKMENDFEGLINEENGILKTIKKDTKNHGIGLENVKKTVERYNGDLLLEYNGNKFKAEITMYEEVDE